MILHIADSYVNGWAWLLMPAMLGLFNGWFCNRKTRSLLVPLTLALHFSLCTIAFSNRL